MAVGEGDLSIHTMDNCAPEMTFPLRHYRGITVALNLTFVSEHPPEILAETGIDIYSLIVGRSCKFEMSRL